MATNKNEKTAEAVAETKKAARTAPLRDKNGHFVAKDNAAKKETQETNCYKKSKAIRSEVKKPVAKANVSKSQTAVLKENEEESMDFDILDLIGATTMVLKDIVGSIATSFERPVYTRKQMAEVLKKKGEEASHVAFLVHMKLMSEAKKKWIMLGVAIGAAVGGVLTYAANLIF